MLVPSARHVAAAIVIATSAVATPLAAASPKAGTVFYSGTGNAGYDEAYPYAEQDLKTGEWTGTPKCSTGNAASAVTGKPNTLAGWSLGRLGPIYYLKEASEARKAALRNILLFDPAAYGEMKARDSCDTSLDVDGLLASWLKMNPANHLVILAGDASLDDKEPTLFRGLRTYYLPKIASQGVASQALVCVVEKRGVPYSHKQTFYSYARVIANGPRNACPKDFQNRSFYGWRPSAEPYANTLVKWNAEKPSPTTTWLVGGDAKRRWVPDGGTYQCLAAWGGEARLLMASVLDHLPDERLERASCSNATPPPGDEPNTGDQGGGGGLGNGTPSVSLAQGPAAPAGYRYAVTLQGFGGGAAVSVNCRDSVDPGGFYTFTMVTDGSGHAYVENQCYSGDGPDHWVVANGLESNHVTWGALAPAPTWSEQETPNHPVNTFMNYHNASGMGPPIAAGQWVQVSCKVYDPFIASVDPDGYWYRIASSPWNNAFYSPANTFMNGDPYGGPYSHDTDFAVPNC
jgi:hypothetical protein